VSKPSKRHKRAATNRATGKRAGTLPTALDAARVSPTVWPVKGPGRRRIVTEGSLDELAAVLANNIAATCVEEIRAAAEQMAHAVLVRMLGGR
jgi:hypothetical protein